MKKRRLTHALGRTDADVEVPCGIGHVALRSKRD
jgi:hypothetical protein